MEEVGGTATHTQTVSAVAVEQVVDTGNGKLGITIEEVEASTVVGKDVEMGDSGKESKAIDGDAAVDSAADESSA